MDNIRGVNPMAATNAVQQSKQAQNRNEAAPAPESGNDTVEISLEARIASTLASTPDVRSDLVSQVKAEIQAGTYETPEKLQSALENLLAEL